MKSTALRSAINEDNPSMTPIVHHGLSRFILYPTTPAPPFKPMWPASNHEGILAWARNVSPGIPSEERTPSPRRRLPQDPSCLTQECHTRPLAPALSVASSPVHRPSPHTPFRLLAILRTCSIRLSIINQQEDSAPPPRPLRQIPSPHPFQARMSASHHQAEAPRPNQSSMIGVLAKHVRTWVGHPTSRQAPPPKRSPQDPAVAGLDPTPFSLARSRGTPSLYIADEDVLPTKDVTTPGDDLFVGWLGRPKQPTKPVYEPAPRDHPAFRARGRKAARAVAYC
jgi:hypothetical protein